MPEKQSPSQNPWNLFENPCGRVMILNNKSIGSILAISGAFLTIVGTVVNSFWMDHLAAMAIWMFSNPIMLAWAIGYERGYWDGGLTGKALIGLYAGLTVLNGIGLFYGKLL
jgi:hypothetical protein